MYFHTIHRAMPNAFVGNHSPSKISFTLVLPMMLAFAMRLPLWSLVVEKNEQLVTINFQFQSTESHDLVANCSIKLRLLGKSLKVSSLHCLLCPHVAIGNKIFDKVHVVDSNTAYEVITTNEQICEKCETYKWRFFKLVFEMAYLPPQ